MNITTTYTLLLELTSRDLEQLYGDLTKLDEHGYITSDATDKLQVALARLLNAKNTPT
jgi:hypothetical protein